MDAQSSRECILVAEDEPLTGELIMALLQKPGRKIVRAMDGETAIQMVRKHHPQLVVLDLFMPVRSGLDVLRTLRKEPDWDNYRIMVLSAQDQKGTEEEARRCGADDFLAKPFDPDELTRCVDRLLLEEGPAK